MNVPMIVALAVSGWALVVTLIVLMFMGADDPGEDEPDAPDGTAGDLLADTPFDCLSRDEQVKRLEAWL